jgi:Cu2+-exporting ATPase/Cu+-exporting ATPase
LLYKAKIKQMAKIIEIPIKGMTCAGCAQAVSRALRRVEGVINAEVKRLYERGSYCR